MGRVNITISDELQAWYTKRSTQVGTSSSSIMAMALYEYYEARISQSTYEMDQDRRGSGDKEPIKRGAQRNTGRQAGSLGATRNSGRNPGESMSEYK